MILKRQPTSFYGASPLRYALAAISGFFSAELIYSLLCVSREAFRLLSVTEDYRIWSLTPAQEHFYNLFFAGIAVVFGISAFIQICSQKPKRFMHRPLRKRARIFNDLTALNWYFLYWFAKLSFLFCIVLGLAYDYGHQLIDLCQDFWYLFPLLVAVLFLQLFKNISTSRINRLIFIALWAFAGSGYSYWLSLRPPVDGQKIEEMVRAKNVLHQMELVLPQSVNELPVLARNNYFNLYLAVNQDKELVIVLNNQIIPLQLLNGKIAELRKENEDEIFCRLYIHAHIKMSFVENVKSELSKNKLLDAFYSTVQHGSKVRFVWAVRCSMHPPFASAEALSIDHRNMSEIDAAGNYWLNGRKTAPSDLKNEFLKIVESNYQSWFLLQTSPDASFADYFFLLDSYKAAVEEARDRYAMKKYGRQYDPERQLYLPGYRDQNDEIQRLIYMEILEK